MKKVAALALVMCLTSSTYAGTAIFNVIGSNQVFAGETVQFEITLNAVQLANFDSANLVIGANELSVDSLVYAQSWIDKNAFPPGAPVPAGIYPSDLFGGGFLTAPTNGELVGIVTVGTTGLAEGFYNVVINSDDDFGTSSLGLGSASESLSGVGRVQVIPEPATLVLLGIGGIAAMRRRRR